MTTTDFIEAIRADIKRELMDELLSELQPEIDRKLYANIFTFAETAKYLRVSETTLRRMVASKEVPHFKQREKTYFRQIDIDQSIKNKLESRGK